MLRLRDGPQYDAIRAKLNWSQCCDLYLPSGQEIRSIFVFIVIVQ
jgi:hypothetical protein